ncbi:MAG: PIN domain-containing protein [Candidatus Sulfotelmatobacter sp.]
MIILDTNVLLALMRNVPDKHVVSWLDRQAQGSIWITSITVLEFEFGLRIKPLGSQRTEFSEQFARLLDSIYHRIAVFGEEAARLSANLTASRRQNGNAAELRDSMIAGIVLANHATLATRNTERFSDVAARVVNPWLE